MKTIGLIGGMSWESTASYYRLINEQVKQRLGGLHSARLVLYSVDFHEIEHFQSVGDWAAAGELLAKAARSLVAAGAEAVVICANTMHKVADMVQSAADVPLIHVVDATADAIKHAGFATVGLLGTRFTMEETFYRDRLSQQHALRVLVPTPGDRMIIHRVIYEELCLGKVRPESRAEFQRVMADLQVQGAQAIVLGCTEISLLISPSDTDFPLFDTTDIHARKAVEWALSAD